MCRRVTCKTCSKPNWAGCGAHVEMVLGDVPKADRCHCRDVAAQPKTAASADAGIGSKFKAWLKQ